MRFRRKRKRARSICSIHRGPIKGKVYRWGKHEMCRRCYKSFCKKFRLVKPAATPPPKKGFWARLLS